MSFAKRMQETGGKSGLMKTQRPGPEFRKSKISDLTPSTQS